MITLKNGCKARNLQEQVAYNTSEITKLKYLVGGAYIELDDTALTHTGTLTSDMKKVLDAYEIVYVILKQDNDLYQVFRTDYFEQKFRKSAIFIGGSLHKLDLDYDNSTWTYSEQAVGGIQVQSDWTQTDTTQVDYIKHKPNVIEQLGNETISGQPYHFPYTIENLRFDSVDNKIKAQLFTITLDNNKTLVQYPLEVSVPLDTKQNLIQNVTLTGTNGTLTDAQLSLLQANQCNYILVKSGTDPDFVYEKYDLMEDKTANGYIAYTHVEKESTSYKAKTITITISTKAWVLTEQVLADIKVQETLAGTEDALSELTRNGVKYKVEHTTATELFDYSMLNIGSPVHTDPTIGDEYTSGTISYKNNPSTSSPYNLSDFDYVVILYVYNTSSVDINTLLSEEIKICSSDSSKKYRTSESAAVTGYNPTYTTFISDVRILVLSNTSVSINECYREEVAVPTSTGALNGVSRTRNSAIIPYKIIGYKYS